MAIYAKCCGYNFKSTKRKCDKCNKIFTKYVARVQDPVTRLWKTKTVPTLKLAKDIEIKLKTELIEGNLFDKKQTGSIDFEKYLEYSKFHKKSWKIDVCRWNTHVRDSDYRSTKGIVKILTAMKEQNYSDCTIHHVLKLIKRVYNWSIENEYYYEKNPCNAIKPPKYDNRVTDYLSLDEINYLMEYLNSWGNFRASNIIKFAIYTGRRKSEITNLEWNDVDLINRTMTCRNTKNGKTLSFPLNNKAFEVITIAFNAKECNYVFPSSTGHNYYNGFSLAWARLKKRIGLDHRFHNLRHTFASHLASSGKVNLYTLSNLLGHGDTNLTKRYAHLSSDAVKNANNVIDSIF